MKKTAIFILLILTASFSLARIIPYVSPGITIGYNMNNKCFSFIPKVSLGIANWEATPHFYTNITLGWNLLTRRSPGFNHSNYLFAEIQGGSYLFGGGFGYAFAKKRGENRWKIYRKHSISIGSFLYLNAHMVKTETETNQTFGLQAALPIPLVYVDLF
jgi:hypothetical protein